MFEISGWTTRKTVDLSRVIYVQDKMAFIHNFKASLKLKGISLNYSSVCVWGGGGKGGDEKSSSTYQDS